MKISKNLTVVAIAAPVTDKNGIAYKQITVSTASQKLTFNEVGQATISRIMPRKGTFNAWEKNYPEMLNLARKKGVEMEELTQEDLKSVSADFAYDLKVNDKLLGDVVTRKVEPYEVPNNDGEVRVVDTYSCVVLGDTSDEESFEAAIKTTFQRNGRKLVSKDTNPMYHIPTAVEEDVKTAFAE